MPSGLYRGSVFASCRRVRTAAIYRMFNASLRYAPVSSSGPFAISTRCRGGEAPHSSGRRAT